MLRLMHRAVFHRQPMTIVELHSWRAGLKGRFAEKLQVSAVN
jgi:hypothetical protein